MLKLLLIICATISTIFAQDIYRLNCRGARNAARAMEKFYKSTTDLRSDEHQPYGPHFRIFLENTVIMRDAFANASTNVCQKKDDDSLKAFWQEYHQAERILSAASGDKFMRFEAVRSITIEPLFFSMMYYKRLLENELAPFRAHLPVPPDPR